MKRIILIITILILATALGWSQQRYALLVGISDYPAESGWNKLHSYNDIYLVKQALSDLECGFRIAELKDAQATHDGIVRSMKVLRNSVREGDQCIILFSCHGQQITDLDNDELARDASDHYDESIVPYDAMIAYNWHGYKGENHLRDDELNRLLHDIKMALGSTGQLIVLFDACHSGDMSRAEKESSIQVGSPRRGTADAFRIPPASFSAKKTIKSHPVDWVAISACYSKQNNYEVIINGEWYGRLAYSFSKVIRQGITFGELVNEIQSFYKELPTDPDKPIQIIDYHIPFGAKGEHILK